MTCGDIIAKVDALEPNQYGTTQKLEWLSILDGQVINEQILTHEFFPGVPEWRWVPWPDPFGRDGRPCTRLPFPPQSGMPSQVTFENRPICSPPPPPPDFPCACGERRKAVINEDSEWTPEDEENYIRYGDGTCEIPDEDEDDEPPAKPDPKPPYTSESDELLIRDPYGSQVYQHWLQAQIASENAEIAKYNQQMMLYNAAYQTYADWLNRNFMPRRPRGGSRFHY